ncbi:MAG TPA: hypothetical protein VH502_10250 [Actinoplanes sp.]
MGVGTGGMFRTGGGADEGEPLAAGLAVIDGAVVAGVVSAGEAGAPGRGGWDA